MNTEEILTTAAGIVQSWDWATEVTRTGPKQLDVVVKMMGEFVPIIVGLRVKRLAYLAGIVGLDLGPESGEMEVLYHFCPGDALITLRVRVPREGGMVPSLSGIIPSAEVYERELREMFGVEIDGLRNKAHLYLPDGWPEGAYPLRKDFDPSVLAK
jgi:Ni,Fe-hydrogenase III component G